MTVRLLFMLCIMFLAGCVFAINAAALLPINPSYEPKAWKCFASLFFACWEVVLYKIMEAK